MQKILKILALTFVISLTISNAQIMGDIQLLSPSHGSIDVQLKPTLVFNTRFPILTDLVPTKSPFTFDSTLQECLFYVLPTVEYDIATNLEIFK